MSEDDSSPKRKKKLKIRLLSESESEDQGDPVRMRKHLRVVSEDESSDSSVPGARRTRTLPQLRDYHDESGSYESESDHSDEEPSLDDTQPIKSTGCASDSSEGNSDKCPICLLRFSEQMVGIPENCEHLFCVDCITEWSKNVNTCPVDRITFSKIIVRACAGGRVLHTRDVEVKDQNVLNIEEMFADDITRCQICESSEDGASMLLCDMCDQGFHMQCMTPPLHEIPEGDWYCPTCVPRITIDLDTSNMFMERLEARFGRTRGSRSQVQTEPTTSARVSSSGASTRRIRSKTTSTGRRKTRRRTRTVVTEYEIQDGNKFPVKRKVPVKRRIKKRKIKKRVPRTAARRSLVRASVRERLASLRSQMSQLNSASDDVQQLTVTRHRAGIPTLNLFGNRNELEYFSEDEQDETGSSSMAVALRPTSSVLSAYRQARRKMILIPSPPHASSAPDLLSNIMESQSLLHSKKSLISITVDGKVNIKLQGSGSFKNTNKWNPKSDENLSGKDDKVDLTTGENSTKKAPSYPGHSRGGGWGSGSGGGYRGGYQSRDQGNNNNRPAGNYGQNNGSYGGGNNYGGNYRGSAGGFQGNQDSSYRNVDAWQGDSEPNFPDRRRDQLDEEDNNINLPRHNPSMRDEPYNNRNNTHRQNPPPLMDNDSYNRPNIQNPPPLMDNSFNRHNVPRHVPLSQEETPYNRNNMQRLIPPPSEDDLYNRPSLQRPLPPIMSGGPGTYTRSLSDQGRLSLAPSWQPYQSDVPIRPEQNPSRHSFGGFEQEMDALDMRVSQNEPNEGPMDLYGDIQHPRENTPPQQYDPLPEPPVFRFEKPADDEDDESLVIDTEKYDPTEPTLDESSGEEEEDGVSQESVTEQMPFNQSFPQQQTHAPYVPQFSRDPDIPFGPQLPIDHVPSSPLKVPPTLLDKAVQQVLNEHRNLIAPTHVNRSIVDYKSDEESGGDCPNFSIYSATSVNIANSSGASVMTRSTIPPENDYLEKEEDLVQEDDDIPVPEEHSAVENPAEKSDSFKEPEQVEEETLSAKEKAAQDEFKERLSRRCPITPNKRNPIKIKLNNTPSLIKRHVLDLYADEDEEESLEESKNVSKKDKVLNKTEDQPVKDDASKEKREDEPNISISVEVDTSILSSSHETKCSESTISNNKQSENNELSKEDAKSKTCSENAGFGEEPLIEAEKPPEENKSEDDNDPSDDELHDDKTPKTIDQKHSESLENLADTLEKMTESVSESEDERSYTPCLDENKSKDTSLENEKENVGIEGLDTEMISEEEGNEMFSDGDEQKDESEREESPRLSPLKDFTPGEEEGEIIEIRKEIENKDEDEEGEKEEGKKKKRKEKKPTSKLKAKTKKSDITFKKLSKSGKERNYRDKEEKGKTKGKDRKKSDDKESREKAKEKRREKRKDMERYDVRNIVSEKRRRVKDAFGRDSSRPRSKSPSILPSLSPHMRSLSQGRRSISLTGLRRSLSRGARSISRSRRSLSKSKERYTPSIRRSTSRGRKSFTPISPRLRSLISPRGRSPLSPIIRRSISPRIRLTISPQMRRSISPRIRRSISPRIRRSISPQLRGLRRSISRGIHRSISPRLRRSLSPRPRRSISPRGRRSVSHRKRKSVSLRARRKNRHSMSPRRRRSFSRGRKRMRRSLSKSPKAKKSPRKKSRRSRSRMRSLSRNRSRTPKPKKARRTKARKSRSPKRKSPKSSKKRPVVMRSLTPELMLSPERIRERVPPVWRNDKVMYQEWSDSRSINSRMVSPSWTPPREPSPDPRRLRVFLENKDKTNRKEKKKRQRETERRPKQLRRGPDAGPSKEVFTSGNNILVSVSFNKDDVVENQDPIMGDLGPKKRKRKDESKKDRKERLKKRRLERKNKDLENKKPVAIIDLDKSPFRELTPSPKNVIILSDSDHCEKEDEMNQRQQVIRNELREAPTVQEVAIAPHREQSFINSVGPKTPPEPSVKFSIMPKTNAQLRAVNPLHEEEEREHQDEPENEENEMNNHIDGTHKGPNTPPDPPNTPPSSPDAYDPFEPTKSGSATPEQDPGQNGDRNADPQEKATITLETAQKTNLSADDVVNQRPITPIEKVMALLQSTRNVSPTNVTDDMSTEQPMESDLGSVTGTNTNAGQSPDRTNTPATKTGPPQSHFSVNVAPTVSSSAPIYLSTGIPRIGAFTNAPSPRANSSIQVSSNQRIVLPSPTKSSPLKTQPAKLFLAKPSPIKSTPIKPMPSKTIISKLPLPSVKPIPGRKKNSRNADVIDLDMDMDSPYSPGSSDFGDLFEPPTDGKSYQKSGKSDIFDTLFGSKAKKNKSSATKVPVKHIKKKGNKTQVGVRIDDDSLKILDDLPSSAVEMQVKSKFLKKLNRQERVVEEVKLVLKPHYNKKHVTKEQYKDILRRTVPKICHNKTGEINPSKIQALVEAYVRKCRKKHKNTM